MILGYRTVAALKQKRDLETITDERISAIVSATLAIDAANQSVYSWACEIYQNMIAGARQIYSDPTVERYLKEHPVEVPPDLTKALIVFRQNVAEARANEARRQSHNARAREYYRLRKERDLAAQSEPETSELIEGKETL